MHGRWTIHALAALGLIAALGVVLPAHHLSHLHPHAGDSGASVASGHSCCPGDHDQAPADSREPHDHDNCEICLIARSLVSMDVAPTSLAALAATGLHPIPPPVAVNGTEPLLPFSGRAPPAFC